MIAIIDYGMGNLRSVKKAFEKIGDDAVITREKNDIKRADKIVLPGVGSFGDCMKNLTSFSLVGPIIDAIKAGKPYLGICLGLQILFSHSEESGGEDGLGIFRGKVARFQERREAARPSGAIRLKVPHMGWNSIKIKRCAPLFRGVEEGSYFYFVHSYYVMPEDDRIVASTTDYGIPFVSSIWQENIFACQFHPEKSQMSGLRLLRNFVAL